MYVHNTAVIWANGEVEGFSAWAFSEHLAEEKALRKIIEKASFLKELKDWPDGVPVYKLLKAADFKRLSPAQKQQIRNDWKTDQEQQADKAAKPPESVAEKLLNMVESDLDDADMNLLNRRMDKQYNDKAQDIVKQAFGGQPPKDNVQVTDAIKIGSYRTPRNLRSIKNMSDDQFVTTLKKLDRDAYIHVITPQWARAIAMRLLGDNFQKLPRLGYEMKLGTVSTGQLKNDPQGLFGDKSDVYLVHDSRGYYIRLHRA